MNWKTFKEEKPKYNTPIFVYKTNGVYDYFKKSDDVRPCRYTRKSESKRGLIYFLEGYDYGSVAEIGFSEKDFNKMKWMEIPKP